MTFSQAAEQSVPFDPWAWLPIRLGWTQSDAQGNTSFDLTGKLRHYSASLPGPQSGLHSARFDSANFEPLRLTGQISKNGSPTTEPFVNALHLSLRQGLGIGVDGPNFGGDRIIAEFLVSKSGLLSRGSGNLFVPSAGLPFTAKFRRETGDIYQTGLDVGQPFPQHVNLSLNFGTPFPHKPVT